MGMEMRGGYDDVSVSDEGLLEALNQPLNGTDARRRLEDKLEEKRLLRELREFDFEF